MNRFRVFVWGLALTGATLVAAGSLSAQTTTRDKYQARLEQKAKARSAFNLRTHTPDFTLNVNNWLCGLASDGEICTNTFGSTTGGGGFWPIGTPNQYSFFAGLQMAARSPLDPTKFAAAHCFNVSATNAGCRPLSNVYHSDLDTDLATWPGSCNLWNPQTGEYVKTLSQLDTCVRYWDGDPVATVPGGHPLGVEVTQHSLAFTLQGFRDMIFFIFKIKNISNSAAFRQANASLNVPADGWTLEDFYVAVGHDADVSADEVDENFGTFVPFLRLAPDTIPLFLATIWQSDFVAGDFTPYAQCGFCSNPGFVGTTFLRSPYNNTGKTITTNTVGVVRTIPSLDDRARLEALRLAAAQGDTEAQDTLAVYEIGQSFGSLTTRGGVFPDAADAAQSWRYYSGNLSAAERALNPNSPPGFGFVDQPQHADTRYLHATGPIKLAPGDSVEVIVGLVAGAPVLTVPGFVPAQGVEPLHGIPGDTARLLEKIMGRGVEGTNYPSVFKQVLDARTLFETNFLLPSPPASPTVTAIPGDREVKVIWSGEAAVDTVGDPYYPVAIQRGLTTFRKVDFEGYRVYRRVRPNAAPELIAQYDLKNGLTSVITTTDSVITADGSVVPVKQDTAIAGEDTGLRFSLIDRGGKFPDPANGPGLLNGVTYYYTVTAYDINTPFAPGGSSLESGQRLSAKIQDVGGAAVKPRVEATSFKAASFDVKLIGGDGSELDPDAAEPTIDSESGRFSGPFPP
ncbi:MAG: hypothetical protein HY705_09595, partial [Gemmatimonadetes bacterium]|nr:hypothetical protein [Gemmatimonadota bacterium]